MKIQHFFWKLLFLCFLTSFIYAQPELKEVQVTKKGDIKGFLISFDTEFASSVYVNGDGSLGWIEITVPGGSLKLNQSGEPVFDKELSSKASENYPFDTDTAIADKIKKAGNLTFEYFLSTANKPLVGKVNRIFDLENQFELVIKYFSSSSNPAQVGKIDRIFIKKTKSSFDGQIVLLYYFSDANPSMVGKISAVQDMRNSSAVKGSQKFEYYTNLHEKAISGKVSKIYKIVGLDFQKYVFNFEHNAPGAKLSKIGKADINYSGDNVESFGKQPGIQIKIVD